MGTLICEKLHSLYQYHRQDFNMHQLAELHHRVMREPMKANLQNEDKGKLFPRVCISDWPRLFSALRSVISFRPNRMDGCTSEEEKKQATKQDFSAEDLHLVKSVVGDSFAFLKYLMNLRTASSKIPNERAAALKLSKKKS
jgi:hypothetical protein